MFATKERGHAPTSKVASIFQLYAALLALSSIPIVGGMHHMSRKAPRKVDRRKEPMTPLLVTNNCPEVIYPGISTQSGEGPKENGFKLDPGKSYNQTVSEDWQGRVWGRTNCSFNDDGTKPKNGGPKACGSGDCNGIVNCKVGVSSVALSLRLPYNGQLRRMMLLHGLTMFRVTYQSLLRNLRLMLVMAIPTTTYH